MTGNGDRKSGWWRLTLFGAACLAIGAVALVPNLAGRAVGDGDAAGCGGGPSDLAPEPARTMQVRKTADDGTEFDVEISYGETIREARAEAFADTLEVYSTDAAEALDSDETEGGAIGVDVTLRPVVVETDAELYTWRGDQSLVQLELNDDEEAPEVDIKDEAHLESQSAALRRGANGSWSYCAWWRRCDHGQGDCDSDRECKSGNTCRSNVGANYGWSSAVDVCERTGAGGASYCSSSNKCEHGEGDCDSNAHCVPGAICVMNVGARYGWSSGTDVCESCVNDVVGTFRKVRTHGDKLGYKTGSLFPSGYTGLAKHFQGIQRLRNGKFMAVTGSHDRVSHLFIVEMGSRPSRGKYRSNRLSSNTPPSNDVVVAVEEIDSHLKHAGGLQVTGDYLAIGVEEGQESKVFFYDVSNPRNPVKLPYVIDRPNVSAGATAIVQQSDGRFLVLVGGYNSNDLDFYRSTRTSLATDPGFTFVGDWNENSLTGMDREFGNYQNINLVRQCDGQLYFVGLHKNSYVAGQDWIDLFRLNISASGSVSIRKMANRHLYCRDTCNFDAGAGIFFDSATSMIVYGIEHKRASGRVRFNEFRSIPTSSDLPVTSISGSWAELYDDSNFGDRSIVADYVDRNVRNYNNYDDVEGFEDKASAAKWMIAPGWQYLLFEDKNRKGDMFKLVGSDGRLRSISRLGDHGWNDKVSSSMWARERITSISHAWVELFDDAGYTDRRLRIVGNSSSSIRNYKHKTVEGRRGFGDKVSSARWQIPAGYTYRLYEHDRYRGRVLRLQGNGRVQEIRRFSSHNFNDKVSSSRY